MPSHPYLAPVADLTAAAFGRPREVSLAGTVRLRDGLGPRFGRTAAPQSDTSEIDSLYEGTTAIQAPDLFFRKIVRDRGEAFAHVAAQISETIDTCDTGLKTLATDLGPALEHVQAMTATVDGLCHGGG